MIDLQAISPVVFPLSFSAALEAQSPPTTATCCCSRYASRIWAISDEQARAAVGSLQAVRAEAEQLGSPPPLTEVIQVSPRPGLEVGSAVELSKGWFVAAEGCHQGFWRKWQLKTGILLVLLSTEYIPLWQPQLSRIGEFGKPMWGLLVLVEMIGLITAAFPLPL